MSRMEVLPRTLTRRYALALLLMAVLATIAMVGTDFVISRQESTAALINIAARQRMRSQQAVLYAERLTSDQPARKEDAQHELRNTIEALQYWSEMLSSRGRELGLTEGMTPALRRLYFEGQDAVDPLMRRFIMAARSLLSKSEAGPIAADDTDLATMYELGTTRLLRGLDSVATHFEVESESAAGYLRVLEVIVWLLEILVLVGVALLVFAPMVRRLKESLDATARITSALVKSEERFTLSAQGASVGIRDHFDLRQDEEYWSPLLYHLLGYVPGELPPRASSFNKLVDPRDRQIFHDALEHHLEEHAPLEFKCRLRHKTHGYRWFLITGQAKWGADGAPRHLITSIKDIDDSVRAERMRSEFVSTVSHELRTPLTSIMGALSLIRAHVAGQISEKAEQLVTIAHENCERLVRLINDLLDVEKIEAGKVTFIFKEENLAKLVAKAKEENDLYAQQHGATIVVGPVAQDATVEVDEARFAQVMANLLSNAARYSPPGGTIKIATKLLDGAVRISVTDQGPGIPAEFHDRIFQRFAQAEAADGRKRGGTGLGLNIASAIVEAHNGTIGFETSEGKGTTFHFELPTTQPGAVPVRASLGDFADIAEFTAGTSELPRSARMLVVAVDANDRSAIARQVSDLAELTTAATCQEAAGLLARHSFDLMIVDRPGFASDGGLIFQTVSDRSGPGPIILLYNADGKGASTIPAALLAPIKAEVDARTLRQVAIDELRAREDQLATRFKSFKKSA
jgi:signal transduction histidine kinase